MIRKIPEGHGPSHLLSFPFSQHLSESEPEHGHRSGNSYGISNRLSQENCKDIIFHKRPFSKITNKYQMNHRAPEAVVKGLIETYGLVKSEKASPPAYDTPWNGRRYTLRVYPAGMSRSVYRVIEISGNDTLNQLCGVILDSYDFGDDWMFTIHVQKIDEAAAYKEAKVIREKGAVEQYPEWDEEE